jgi:hypothetical protein
MKDNKHFGLSPYRAHHQLSMRKIYAQGNSRSLSLAQHTNKQQELGQG